MRRQWIAGVLLASLIAGTGAGAAIAAPKTFGDVSGTFWAKEEIEFLVDREVISGYPDGRFGVNDSISRAQAAAMIMRSLGWGYLGGRPDPGYTDIQPSHWAYNEIATIVDAGFYAPEGSSFEPDRKVTRGEMAAMLVDTFDLRSTDGARFTDLKPDHPNYDAIMIVATNEISTGYPDGTFGPDRTVTRSEFAVFLARALNESFRPASGNDAGDEYVQVLYDVEIGGERYQLDHPLRISDRSLLPIELFERMGFTVRTEGGGRLTLTAPNGTEIELQPGQREVWVGGASVEVANAVEERDGTLYVEGTGILRELKTPLVNYPDQRLVRIEVPRITAADIKAQAPAAIIGAVHEELPYWQWEKRDRDYLELIRRGGVAGKEAQLRSEMAELTDAFFAYEREKQVIRGLNYYADHVTGKMDAASRGIEARYLLLSGASNYAYPEIGRSGGAGPMGQSLEFRYLVSDWSFDFLEENRQALIREIETNRQLNFELLEGLNIHAIPFSLGERLPDGSLANWAGMASGSQMLVVNSAVGTFVHEFGHNWDYKFGDTDSYLELRGKTGYAPADGSWEAKVEENFAEDFASAFLGGKYEGAHKAVFGQPSEAQNEAFRQWVAEREASASQQTASSRVTLNGAGIVPDVMVVRDGSLRLAGTASNVVHGMITNKATGERIDIEIPSHGTPFAETITLPGAGVYEVGIASFSTTIIYQP